MKEVKIPQFKTGGIIEHETHLFSEPQDIEDALNMCIAAKKAMKKDGFEYRDFLSPALVKKNYRLKGIGLPIYFSEEAIFIDGFRNCLKRLIRRLEEIKMNNQEIHSLIVSRKK